MKKFTGDIIIKRLGKALWVLKRDWTYQNEEIKATAKEGLTTDGASILKVMWNIIGSPFSGKYVGAAIIHDTLYASEALPRKQCDKLFLEMMEVENVSWWRRNVMYWAVRIGGGFVWKKHTTKSVKDGKKYCEVHYENSI